MSDELKLEREDLIIEGGRNLHSYTFRDASGKLLEPEPIIHVDQPKESPAAEGSEGTLGSKEGENRKG